MIGIVNGRVRGAFRLFCSRLDTNETGLQEGGMIYLPWLWGIIMGAWFMRLMKSRTLLIPMFRKSIGL